MPQANSSTSPGGRAGKRCALDHATGQVGGHLVRRNVRELRLDLRVAGAGFEPAFADQLVQQDQRAHLRDEAVEQADGGFVLVELEADFPKLLVEAAQKLRQL